MSVYAIIMIIMNVDTLKCAWMRDDVIKIIEGEHVTIGAS